MTLLSLVFVLVLEQARPLAERRLLGTTLARYARLFEDSFNDGRPGHATIAWCLAVLPPVLACAAIHIALASLNPVLALLWNVTVLYFTFGFRQFSHFFTDIHLALRMGEIERARTLLTASDYDVATIASLCGFADQPHLTRAFKRAHGTTPAAYRRARRR